ncbi:hypothetical protein GOP47_0030117 [Adiantum capillus-veneris]|nr:hypothetical protein GOP47_0030117 [Adiantum capillus-veneris]
MFAILAIGDGVDLRKSVLLSIVRDDLDWLLKVHHIKCDDENSCTDLLPSQTFPPSPSVSPDFRVARSCRAEARLFPIVFSFQMTDLVVSSWRRALLRLFVKLRSWAIIVPSLEVELFNARCLEHRASGRLSRRNSFNRQRSLSKPKRINARISANGAIYVVKVKQEKNGELIADGRKIGRARRKDSRVALDALTVSNDVLPDAPQRFVLSGGSKTASLFSRQGMKGVNQDAMLVLEDFAAQTGTTFCGVFDGHGPDGHLVARKVRDLLPQKLASCWQATNTSGRDLMLQGTGSFLARAGGDPQLIMAWTESLIKAHKQMDRELLLHDDFDCVSSGTTAVTFVKQGNDLYIGNVGDSRAVLGMTTEENSLMALQLTIDLKPNLPKEAERIRRFKGRVFALRTEPSVKRVWLPHMNTPGLAMARSLGDYCLKNFGVISEPVITYRRLSVRDRFIILASDGVWDVLSNEQAVEIVASVSVRSSAAKAVVQAATRAWKAIRPQFRMDDCTAVCFFLDDLATSSASAFKVGNEGSLLRKSLSTVISLQRRLTIDKSASFSELELLAMSASRVAEVASLNGLGMKKRKFPE